METSGMGGDSVEDLLEQAIRMSDDTEVNFHIRQALQKLYFKRELEQTSDRESDGLRADSAGE